VHVCGVYPQNLPDDVYRLYNVKKGRLYRVLKKQGNESGYGDSVVVDNSATTTNSIMNKKIDQKTKIDFSNKKFYNKMKLLKSSLNPEASKVMESLLSGREIMMKGADALFFLVDNSGKPTKFHEAYNHPKPEVKVNRRNAVCKEFQDMKNKGVLEVITKEKIRGMGSSGQDWWHVVTTKFP
jgi:hypothetical protein